MTTTTETTTLEDNGASSAPQVDYGELDSVQTLAAAASNPEAFETALHAVLHAPETSASIEAKTSDAPEAAKPALTPDYESQFRALEQSAAEREHQNAQLQQQLAVLQAQLALQNNVQNQPAEQTEKGTDGGSSINSLPDFEIDPALFGDLSETAIAKGLKQALQQVLPHLREHMRAEATQQAQQLVEQQIKPVAQQQEAQAASAHEAAILAKHPDAHEALASVQFRQWINDLPTFAREGVLNVIDKGTTKQVIEMFDTFKSGLPVKPAMEKKAVSAPLSLSQVQGSAPATNPLTALSEASGEAQLAHMGNMPLNQVEQLMDAAQRAMLH